VTIRPSRSTTLYQFIQEQLEAMNRTTVAERDAKNGYRFDPEVLPVSWSESRTRRRW